MRKVDEGKNENENADAVVGLDGITGTLGELHN
jgi:hypothetical protein